MAVAGTVAAVAALLVPSVLDLVLLELALGGAILWPVVSEPRAGLTIRRLVRRPRRIRWSSITEVVCRPSVEEPESGPDRVEPEPGGLSHRNPGLAAVLDTIEAHAPAAARTKGTWLRR